MTTSYIKPDPAEEFRGPVFVVGMWRSGTSLLYALLNQHPRIALMYEGNLPLLWPLFRDGKTKQDWLERWEFWSGALSRHKIDTHVLPSEFPSLPAAVEVVYRQYAGLAQWGCKSPHYFDYMIRLAKDFPKGRFIVIYRDPFEICRSVVRAGQTSSWFAKPGMPLRALLGYHEMKKQAGRLVRIGAHVHELQYEDLVRDPPTALSAICNFLQIPFDARMTSLESADRSAIHDSAHHAAVKGKQIREFSNRSEVLSSSLRKKIQRYVNFWHRQYSGLWPAHPEPNHADTAEAGLMERSVDTILYHALRAYDWAVILFYCFAPLRMLRTYRGMYGSRLGA